MKIHSIELTNNCNLRCGYCPNGKGVSYPKGYLKTMHFLKALEYAIPDVGISGCGESLLHPDICSFIKIARKYGNNPGINTNGLLLTPDLCKELADAGLTHMEISIHTEESYKKYKMIYDLKLPIKLIANVLTVNHDKAILWRGGDLLPFKMHSTHNWTGDASHPTVKCIFISQNWCQMKWDGTIVACCFDFEGMAKLGHIDNFKELKHGSYELCKTCSPAWVTGQNDTYWWI